MNRLLALIAFLAFCGFVLILIVKVPSPDLIVVAVLTIGLVAWDLLTSSGGRRG